MASFPSDQVLAACAQYGPQLQVPDGLDPVKVMTAIAGNESTVGANCGPRHEPAFDVGGLFATGQQAALLATYGSAAACSYGPLQMLFPNFNHYVITVRQAANLEQIGMCWNAGHVMTNPGPGVVAYCQQLQSNYDAA